MKIVLFGSTGMLGNYVNKYLSQFYDVVQIDRITFDIEKCDWQNLNNIVELGDIIINCAGAIPQQKCDIRKYISVNTLFPHKLNEISKKYGKQFIHITTDCVFSGKDGNYNENSKHDADDIYGISKSLGEDTSMCIIRTSIIGEEINNKNSLIESKAEALREKYETSQKSWLEAKYELDLKETKYSTNEATKKELEQELSKYKMAYLALREQVADLLSDENTRVKKDDTEILQTLSTVMTYTRDRARVNTYFLN